MRSSWIHVAVAMSLAAVAAGCTGGPDDETVEEGRVVDVFGPYRGDDADAFAESMEGFEDRTGIAVRYVGSANFVADLGARLDAGVDLPGAAIVPQRGIVDELIAADRVVELDEAVAGVIEANFDPSVVELDGVASDDAIHGVPYRQTIKSLVWFRPEVFAERGWSVPASLDELRELVEEIADEGDLAPWCFGIAAGTATGWTATDWVEDLLLRLRGADVYDEWVDGERPFDDPAVREAFAEFESLVLEPDRHVGDVRTIVQTRVADVPSGLFGDEPGCAMYKQANFALSWMPDQTSVGPDGDVDVFVLPGADDEAAPLVVGGDTVVAFDGSPEVQELMAYLASADGASGWDDRGGFVSGRRSTASDTTGADRIFADLLLDDRLVRADGSDAMSPEIGSSLWWSEITSWIGGATSLDDMVATLDEARSSDGPDGS